MMGNVAITLEISMAKLGVLLINLCSTYLSVSRESGLRLWEFTRFLK